VMITNAQHREMRYRYVTHFEYQKRTITICIT